MARILVIDDHADLRRLMRRILEEQNYEVVEAANGQDAFRAMSVAPDAIFVDVDMPHMTGVQFLLTLRRHPTFPQTPATFVTAHSDRVSVLADAGIAEPTVIAKPFRKGEIVLAASRMLASIKRRNVQMQWQMGGSSHSAFLSDVRSDGVYLRSDVMPTVGQTVVLALPSKTSIRARVTRHGADGFGCVFDAPSTDFSIALNALLSDGTVMSGQGAPLR